MPNRGIRGVGGNKDVAAWLRKLAKQGRHAGITVTHCGDRNPHWDVSLHGRTIATVGATTGRGGFASAKGDVAGAETGRDHTMNTKVVLAGAVLAAGLAGCASHSLSPQHQAAASSAAASVRAHASALATSPAVLAAEKKVAAKAQSCSTPNGFTLQITGAGTPAMQARVTHVSMLLPLHPVKSVEAWGRCVGLTRADVLKLDEFTKAEIRTNGFGAGEGTKDFTAIVNYAAALVSKS